MTNPKLIFKGDKLLLIDAPEEPKKCSDYHYCQCNGENHCQCQLREKEYEEALSKAPTWEIKNQDDVKYKLWQEYMVVKSHSEIVRNPISGWKDWQPEQGKLYDIPDGYTYKFVEIERGELLYPVDKTITVAILIPQEEVKDEDYSHPLTIGQMIEEEEVKRDKNYILNLLNPKEMKEESQDELWDELIEEGSLIADDQKMKELYKSKFILTRR